MLRKIKLRILVLFILSTLTSFGQGKVNTPAFTNLVSNRNLNQIELEKINYVFANKDSLTLQLVEDSVSLKDKLKFGQERGLAYFSNKTSDPVLLTFPKIASNFHIVVEYKWKKSTIYSDGLNGLLYNIETNGAKHIKSYMCVLDQDKASDLMGFGSYNINVPMVRDNDFNIFQYIPDGTEWRISSVNEKKNYFKCMSTSDLEYEEEVLNKVEILCVNDDCMHILNGVKNLRFTKIQEDSEDQSYEIKIGLLLMSPDLWIHSIRYRPINFIPVDFLK